MNRDRLVGHERAVETDPVVEVAPLDVLEDQVMPPLVEPPVVDRDDVRVVQRLGALGLADEPLEERRVLGQGPGQDLDRDDVAGFLVDGPEDVAHPARAQRLDQEIAPEPGGGLGFGARNRLRA